MDVESPRRVSFGTGVGAAVACVVSSAEAWVSTIAEVAGQGEVRAFGSQGRRLGFALVLRREGSWGCIAEGCGRIGA